MNAKLPLALFATALMPIASAGAASIQAEHLRIELVSEAATIAPGKTAWLGLVLRHKPHWHTYWINPGDSGLPTRLKWTLPKGFKIDEVSWPAPTRFELGGLFNFGYSGEQLLPIALHVPVDASPGEIANLKVEAKWLICREECITGKATLQIDLPIAANEGPATESNQALFTSARAAIPQTTQWSGDARIDGDQILIALHGDAMPSSEGLDVFAVERRILANSPVKVEREGETLLILGAKNDYFDEQPPALDLVLTRKMTNGHVTAWKIRVPFVSAAAEK